MSVQTYEWIIKWTNRNLNTEMIKKVAVEISKI